MEAGQVFKSRILNNTPSEEVWGFQKKKKGFEPFSESSTDSVAAKPTKFFLWLQQVWRLAHTDHWMGAKA